MEVKLDQVTVTSVNGGILLLAALSGLRRSWVKAQKGLMQRTLTDVKVVDPAMLSNRGKSDKIHFRPFSFSKQNHVRR